MYRTHHNFELLIKAAAANVSEINAAAIENKGNRKCSISNMLDGTEGDILWMDDADNDDDDEREEELDYHDDCITQQEWDALFNEDNDDEDSY